MGFARQRVQAMSVHAKMRGRERCQPVCKQTEFAKRRRWFAKMRLDVTPVARNSSALVEASLHVCSVRRTDALALAKRIARAVGG